MSKLLEKDHSPLKFDTSSANLNCFIRTTPKSKTTDSNISSRIQKYKKKGRSQYPKHVEFQDKAFLQSVISKILNDADCKGITELIDNMDFSSMNISDCDTVKDNRRQQLQQQKISQIFSDYHPFNKQNYNNSTCIYEQSNELYKILPPQMYSLIHNKYQNHEEKHEMTTTLHTSYVNSYLNSPRAIDDNPEIQMINNMNSQISFEYSYCYYAQNNYFLQPQVQQRKRRTISGQQVQQYRIIPNMIETDGRTTLMIRHIPNKYTEDMLFQQISKNHRLHINFLYLPIDHHNSCNVGYAFANFIHTKFIQDFYKDFNGRRWDRFNSQKICELAYARIQGTTNLMDHFQNSPSGQLRGRTISKCEQRKKSAVQLNEDAIKGLRVIVNHQRVQQN